MNDFNAKVISEFRANGGAAGPSGRQVVLLTTKGRKSGEWRTVPVAYRLDGERIVVLASAAGSEKHPAWYLNLLADPHLTVEVGRDGEVHKYDALATVLEGAEREREWADQIRLMPRFGEYQDKTSREIPVVVLTRA